MRAVLRLHADDRDEVFRRHAALGGNALQRLAMVLPELHAERDALFGEEPLAIFPPRRPRARPACVISSMIFGCGCGLARAASTASSRLSELRFATSSMNVLISGRVEVEAASRRLLHGRVRARRHERDRYGQHEQESTRSRYDPTSFRCEYSDMRIPKPASRVTIEVPP